MTGWEILATIGAVTGVPALIWQVYAQVHTWNSAKPRMRVKVAHALPLYPGGGTGEHHFSVTATNEGGATATVTGWGFRLPNKGGDFVLFQQLPFSEPLPAVVAAQGSATFYIEANDVFARCKERGLKAAELRPFVRLATGMEVLGNSVPWKE